MVTPAVVIVAYNRSYALQRLLTSVAKAEYPNLNIPLVISIDHSDNDDVYKLCSAFEWQHGEKKIITHNENIGLKNHIIKCCSLSETYGAVIVLEDDLTVSPHYYNYALQALNHYNADTKIAGISLYSYAITENGFVPFYPLADGNSTYFMQLPSSWGQLFTAQQWSSFLHWYNSNSTIPEQNALPDYANRWGSKSWKKHFMLYMVENQKYFVYPKHSYSTNFGDPGTNTDRQGLFQVQLMQGNVDLKFVLLNQSNAVYDAWFEIEPQCLSNLVPQLKGYSYTVDLYGTKDLEKIPTSYILSSKPCSSAQLSFGNLLADIVQNITTGAAGSFFSLGKKEFFSPAAFDPINFYVNLNPVKDLVVDNYITEKFKAYISYKEYQETYPNIAFIVLNTVNTEQTIKSIKEINYPADRILIYTSGNLNLLNELSNDASYYVILNSGDIVDNCIATESIAIMKKYPDVNWLTFTSANSLQLQRWNSRLFQLSRNYAAKRTINNRYTVFNHEAIKNEIFGSADTVEELWRKLFYTQQLYTCVSNNIAAADTDKELLENGLWAKVWEYFMIADASYLRSYYRNKQGLPAVIRQTNNGSYFLSDY